MLPRSLLHLLAGAALCSAQQFNYYPQNLPYAPQYQPPQPPQTQYNNIWQPQYDQQSFRAPQFQPQQYQQQFQAPPQQQFQQQAPPQQFQASPPQQYQNQVPQAQFNQNAPVYQPQFQPAQPQFQQQPQQFLQQPQFQPQQQQFQAAPQQNYAPQQQFQLQQPIYQQGNQSPQLPPQPPRPAPAPAQPYQQTAPSFQKPQKFREQPVIFEQIVKIPPQPIQQRLPPPPPPPQPTAQIIQIAAPPPPEKFVPYIADIYTGPSDAKPPVITVITPDESLPSGTYIAEEIIVDGNHPSFIENIEKSQPVRPPPRKTTIQQNSFVPSPQAKLKAPEVPQFSQQNVPQQPPPAPRPAQARPPPTPPAAAKATKAIPSSSGEKTANGVFLSCCKSRKVNKSCERICNFDILNKKTLTGMFLGTDPCPQSAGLDLLQCAAQNDDHTQCCIENEVHKTTAGNKCLGFCNMKPGVSFQADVSMLPCWSVLNDIKECFKENIEDGLAG